MTPSDRRNFLKTSIGGALALGVGSALFAPLRAAAEAAAVSTPMNPKPVPSEGLFRQGVIGPAELSLVTSQLAVDKATDKNTKEFAGFELGEAVAVTTVLKQLGTEIPAPDAKAKETLAKLKAAAKGKDFDKAYIAAQLENHEFLRDHAMDYLAKAKGKTEPAEMHAQHLATLALATFKEHVAITKRILGELS